MQALMDIKNWKYGIFIMGFKPFTILLSIVLVIIAIYVKLYKLQSKPVSKTEKRLFIGITSSSDHFIQRQSLRNSWLKLLPITFDYKFLIGKKLCEIHSSDRLSQYDCERLHISLPKGSDKELMLQAVSEKASDIEAQVENSFGFDFYVHFSVTVHYLGIQTNVYNSANSTLAKVILIDSASSTIISSVTFDIESFQNEIKNEGFIFKKLKFPVFLPMGFEGGVRVKGLFIQGNKEICRKSIDWTHQNVISICNILGSTSQNVSNVCILPSFKFTIKDWNEIESHVEKQDKRTVEWLNYTNVVNTKLQSEAEQYGDILFLNTVDVYRSLPTKMFLFLKWLHENYVVDFLLKTDDDIFIDLPAVKEELESAFDWDWWSCFRVGWPVHKHGKHRETYYKKKIYPVFPSGAGYVLSRRALEYLSTRGKYLSTKYQGEDVAMGVWLEGMNPVGHLGNVCFWACNDQCHNKTCNVMQLSVASIYEMWENYKSCGNRICWCS